MNVRDKRTVDRLRDGWDDRQVCHTFPRGSYLLGKSEAVSSWPDYESCTH